MRSNIFRRWLCIIIAISMIVSGSLVPVGNITTAYASENDFENGDDIEFAGGTGTKDDPYLIETVEQLSNIKHHLKDAFYYKLINDLDFNDIDDEGNSYENVYGDQWVAIGTDPTYFSFQGHFDGGGYTIHNMNITSGTSTGLFGYCNGTITNLKIADSNVTTTGSAAGVLVGELLAGGKIDRCAAEGGSAAAAKYVGGLVGVAYHGAKISNVYVNGVDIGLDYIFMANKVEDTLLGGSKDASMSNLIDVLKQTTDVLSGFSSFVANVDKIFKKDLGGSSRISGLTGAIGTIESFIMSDVFSTARTAAAGGIVGFLSGDLTNAWVYTTGSMSNLDAAGVWTADIGKYWYNLTAGIGGGWLAPYSGPVVGRNFHGNADNVFEADEELKEFDNKSDNKPKYEVSDVLVEGAWFTDTNNVPRLKALLADGYYTWQDKDGQNGEKIKVPVSTEEVDENGVYKELTGEELFSDSVPKAAVLPSDANGDGLYEIYTPYELAALEYKCWWSCELMNDLYLKDCGDPTHEKCTLKDEPIVDHYETVTEDGNEVQKPIYKCVTVGVTEDGKEVQKHVYERNCVDWGYWVPLCRDRDQYYEGDFYGNGHTIYGLEVATNDAGGLFGYVLGDIMDLNVSVDKINAYGPAGGLAAGVFYPGNIYRCSVVGPHGLAGDDGEDKWDINGGANMDGAAVGGLAGIIGKDVEVKDCYTIVNVTNANWWKYYELDYVGTIMKIIVPTVPTVVSSGVNFGLSYNNSEEKRETGLEALIGTGLANFQNKVTNNNNTDEQNLEKLQDDILKRDSELIGIDKDISNLQTSSEGLDTALEDAEQLKTEAARAKEMADKAVKDAEAEAEKNPSEENKQKVEKAKEEAQKAKDNLDAKTKTYDALKKDLPAEKARIQKSIDEKRSTRDKLTKEQDEAVKKLYQGNADLDKKKENQKKLEQNVKTDQAKLEKARKTEMIANMAKSAVELIKGIGNAVFAYNEIRYENRVGGFVGDCRGKISSCYSAGKVLSTKSANMNDFVGAFVGRARNGDTSSSHDGKIMSVSEMINNCYYSANPKWAGAGTALSDMTNEDNYVGFDFYNVWSAEDAPDGTIINNGMPYLRHKDISESEDVSYGFAGGDGSEEFPFLIATKEQFLLIDNLHFQEYHYKLSNNISGVDLSDTSFLGGTNDVDAHFAGHFDGDGYAVSFVNAPNDVEIRGLFPTVSGTVCNLELRNSIIRQDTLNGYFGGITSGSIAGVLDGGGHLENIYINSCTVWGEGTTGGLVGKIENNATVKNCLIKQTNPHLRWYAQPIVGSTQPYMSYGNYGLIAGINYGNVEDCYAAGNIVEHEGNLAEHCRDVKTIGASAIYDGLTGKLTHRGNSQRMYFTMLSDQQEKHENCQGTEVPTNAVNQKASYNGFDFTNTWTMVVDANNNPTGIGLRCMRSTSQSAASQKELEALTRVFTGEGTKENPFVISNATDLNTLIAQLEHSPNGFAGIYFKQMKGEKEEENGNIDLSANGVTVNSIGTLANPFSGVYDGNGYTITLKDKSLFGYIDGATVKNLVIKVNGTINASDNSESLGILSYNAKNSLIFNCSIEADNTKTVADLTASNSIYNGGFAAIATDCNIMNCKTEAILESASDGQYHTGAIVGEVRQTDAYNGNIVGLKDSIKPAVVNCAFVNLSRRCSPSKGKLLCHKLINSSSGYLAQNLVEVTTYDKNKIKQLNNTEEFPDELVEEAYVWKYNEDTNDLTLRPSICDVTIKGTANVSIEKIYKVTVQENRDTWEQIPVHDKYSYTASVRNGTKLVVEVLNKAAEPDLRWEMRDARTNANITSAITENRYVQQEDKNGDEQYGENELLDSSVVEFVVDQDMTVHAYDESDVEFTGLHVSTGGNTIQVSEYEQLTLSALKAKDVQISKAYNYGYSEEVDAADTNLQITPAKFDTAADEETVTVTYKHEGKEYTKQFKVEVIPRVMTDLIVTVPDEGITGIQEYQSINGVSLNDAGVKFYKRYNFGPVVQIGENELSKITAAPVMHEYFGRYKVQVTYTDGAGEESQSFSKMVYISIMPKVMTGISVSKKQDIASIDFQAYEPINALKLKDKISVKKVYAYAPMEEMTDAEKAALTITVNNGSTNYLTTVGAQDISITYPGYDPVTLSVNITPRVMTGIEPVTTTDGIVFEKYTGGIAFEEYEEINPNSLDEKGLKFRKKYEFGNDVIDVIIDADQSGLTYNLIGANAGEKFFKNVSTAQIQAVYTGNDGNDSCTFSISITPRVMTGILVSKKQNVASIEFQANEEITIQKLFERGMEIKTTYDYAPAETLPNNERQYLSVTPSQFTAAGDNQQITITYSNGMDQTYTASLNVNITPSVLAELSVETTGTPSFSEYQDITKESLNNKGVVFKKKYQYGDYVTIEPTDNNLSITLEDVPEGQKYFTGTGNKQVDVAYTENGVVKTTNITVGITAKVVSAISITQNPDKLTYNKGENINLSGGKLRVSYQNTDHTDVIDMTASGVTVEGYNKDIAGTYNVYIRYNGVRSETSFQVTVKDDTYTIKPAQAGFTLASQPGTKQNASGVLWVKNNLQQKNGGNTRRAYVKFDLNSLKTYMDENGLEIESAELSYSANIDRSGTGTRTIYVKKVKENGWTNANLTWRTAPVFEGDIATATVSGTQYQKKTADITAYLNSRISSGPSTATLGFEVSQCGGEVIGIRNTTSDMPTITVILKEAGPSITIDASNQNNLPITSYAIGDNLNLTKGRIKVTYADGRAPEYVALNNAAVTVSGYNKNKLGEQTLTVKYMGAETSYKVTVKDKITSVVVDLVFIKPKLDYSINESLSKTGVAFVTYASGTRKNVSFYNSGITIQGYKANVPGEQTLTVIYTDENGVTGSGTYKVTVHDAISSIAFVANSQPKTNYIQGQTLNRSQGTIRVTYASGRIVNVPFNDSKVTVSGYNKDLVKAQTIKVVYEGKETSYTVNVNKPANQVADLNITFNTAIAGQNLSISSAKVVKYTGTLANTQTSNITDTANIQITDYNINKGGNQTITVSYGGYSEQMTVYVYTKKTETKKIGVSKANHSKKGGSSIAGLTSDGYVKNYYNNTMQTYVKMNLSALQAIEDRSGVEDFTIKSAKLKFQAKGFGNSTKSRYLQVYKVNSINDSTLYNGGNSLPWANNRLKTAIGSHWAVNKDTSRTANWDVTAYVKETYVVSDSILFGFGLTQSDNNKEVRILNVLNESKTYLEVTVEYLQ